MVASTEAKKQKEPIFFDPTFCAPLLAGAASASFGVAKAGPRDRLTGLWGLARPPQGAAREVNGIVRFFAFSLDEEKK